MAGLLNHAHFLAFTLYTLCCSLLLLPPSLRRTDQVGAPGASVVSFGKPNPSQESCNSLDLDICPDLLLAAIAAFGAIAFLVLYRAITMNSNGRRRRSLGARRHGWQMMSSLVYDGRSYRVQKLLTSLAFTQPKSFRFAWTGHFGGGAGPPDFEGSQGQGLPAVTTRSLPLPCMRRSDSSATAPI